MASAVIADDEPLLRAMLRTRLARLWPELEVRHEMADGRDVDRVIEEHAPDLFFLDIHRVRMGSRLEYVIDVPDALRSRSFPPMMLITLVENAIKHGIASGVAGGHIVLSAQRDGSRVDIRIIDNGAGLPPGWAMENAKGLGLSVTRERLLAMYPPGEWSFEVGRHADGGTQARITLPLTLMNEEAHAHPIA